MTGVFSVLLMTLGLVFFPPAVSLAGSPGTVHAATASAPDPSTVSAGPAAASVPLDPFLPEYRWANAFPELTFDDPVVVTSPPGETNRLFVVERTGLIVVLTNLAQPSRTVFLDLRTNLYASYLEAGVLGLAFHPGYATNRQFYVYRTVVTQSQSAPPPSSSTAVHQDALADVLARFLVSAEDPNRADPDSEFRLISQEDTLDTHNAGDLQFGPDGYLYLSLGDETPPPSQHSGDRQPLDLFFGCVLRLDVDQRPGNLPPNPHPGVGGGYSVPADNPLVGKSVHEGRILDPTRVRTEFYAWGFRNPWRIAIDDRTGELFVGDVGGARFEELNLIRPGGNYGWPYREAGTNGIHWFLAPEGATFDAPLITYSHGSGLYQGNSVIGGVIHRGHTLPELKDRLVFGDVRSGHTWALRRAPGARPQMEWLCSEPGLVAYGRDPRDGEVLGAQFAAGRILKLVRTPDDATSSGIPRLPETLSATGVFTRLDTLTPTSAFTAYSINAPFWSDHAIKQRWVSVPSGASARRLADGSLDFPPGTIWVKHFEFELTPGDPASRRRLETRLLVRNEAGVYGATYKWNEAGTDATLLSAEGLDETLTLHTAADAEPETQVWHYPGRAECARCHNAAAGYSLGFSVEQLNRPTTVGGVSRNQVEWLRERGILPADLPPASTLPALVDPRDETQPLNARARSYLASNCSNCHRPGLLTDTTAHWIALPNTPIDETDLLDGRLAIPGDPDNSRLVQVVARTAVDLKMPPLASNVPDDFGVALLRRWIGALPRAPWTQTDLSRVLTQGAASVEAHAITLSGSGVSFGPDTDGPAVLTRSWEGDGIFEATLTRLAGPGAGSATMSGVLVAAAPANLTRPHLALLMDATGGSHQFTTDRAGRFRHSTGSSLPGPVRFRFLRTGTALSGSAVALDKGMGVQSLATLPTDGAWTIGLATASGSVLEQAHAWYDQVNWAEARWASPVPGTSMPHGDPIYLQIALSLENLEVQSIEFLVGDTVIATVKEAPFAAVWPDAPVGTHALQARIQLTDGRSFLTRPNPLTIAAPPSAASFITEDPNTRGDWLATYGRIGFQLAASETHLPDNTTVRFDSGQPVEFDPNSLDPAAAQQLNGTTRSAASWVGTPDLDFTVVRADSESVRVGLYCVDWSGTDQAVQTIELLDAQTGAVLDRSVLSRFSAGVHRIWKISGSVRFRITDSAPGPAVMSALFLDPPRPGAGQAALSEPVNGARFTAPVDVRLAATPANPARPPVRAEFYVDQTLIGETTGPDWSTTWIRATAGIHAAFVRAYDEVGQTSDSATVTFAIDHAPSSAAFLGVIEEVQGDWAYHLGSEAYAVAPEYLAPSANVRFNLLQGTPYRWQDWRTGDLVFDRRAPVAISLGAREAACWTSTEAVLVDLELPDGAPYVVSVYMVDWDTNLRRQRVEWLDPKDGTVLDTRTVSEFFRGALVSYLVRGKVQLRLVPESINAVLSALFVDPYLPEPDFLPPWSSVQASAEGVRLEWKSGRGELFRVQHSEQIGQPWTALPRVLTSSGGDFSFTDPVPPGSAGASRFYRLERLSRGDGVRRLPDPAPAP